MNRIYLDHNATTPMDPAVREEMTACLGGEPGNPSSIHSYGREARLVIDLARARAARLIGAEPEEIVFTSGGTEADNLAVLGVVAAARISRPHVVASSIEHQAVLNPCRRCGAAASYIDVDHEGVIDPESAVSSLREETVFVSIMLANNDVGTLQPVSALSAETRERGIPFHTDAVQAVGKIPVDVRELGVDLLSFSGHKIFGPQGVGALYVRRGTVLSPLMFGGEQERGLRPGTENVAAIAGFGKACELAGARLAEDAARIKALRSSFEHAVLERIPGTTINGLEAPRLSNTSNISFDRINGELLAINLDLLGLAVSTGSACSSTDSEPSHVLRAMGRTPIQAFSSVRFSLGRRTTQQEMERALELVVQAVEMTREG